MCLHVDQITTTKNAEQYFSFLWKHTPQTCVEDGISVSIEKDSTISKSSVVYKKDFQKKDVFNFDKLKDAACVEHISERVVQIRNRMYFLLCSRSFLRIYQMNLLGYAMFLINELLKF